ncbi:MAG TPA: hypothetical protein VJK30_04365 [Coxiellaceae bacterium]|nr:MAG: hypothetical protein A3E81_07615 [Gammaproteobacteria bacterium RIFCSPHIGHO2_12_FULL_36_30]HLB56543.1 hypothetical protein [Coxiellaceae bacterium]
MSRQSTPKNSGSPNNVPELLRSNRSSTPTSPKEEIALTQKPTSPVRQPSPLINRDTASTPEDLFAHAQKKYNDLRTEVTQLKEQLKTTTGEKTELNNQLNKTVAALSTATAELEKANAALIEELKQTKALLEQEQGAHNGTKTRLSTTEQDHNSAKALVAQYKTQAEMAARKEKEKASKFCGFSFGKK